MFELTREDREEMHAFLQDMIRIPSYSTQEGEMAERLAAEMDKVGFRDVHIDRIGNVVGHLGQDGGPVLLYDGHMDVVGAGDLSAWQRDPFAAEIANGLLYGRGTVDMKGALAAMVYGAKMLLDHDVPLHGDLYLAGVVQEEPCEGLGVRVLIEEEGLRPDYVLIGEATSLQLSRGQRGRMEVKVTAHGRSCHASAPERGENAIYSAAEIQAVLLREEVRADLAISEYHSTSFTGYEAHAKCSYPAWALDREHPWVHQVSRAIRSELDYRPEIGRWMFSTDGVYTMGSAGIPTIGFGPGQERYAHAADERIALRDVAQAARGYARIAAEALGVRR
jgi:acetylornithine deacetylase/succinyl-diaminopimelate desuccinylase-like protein